MPALEKRSVERALGNKLRGILDQKRDHDWYTFEIGGEVYAHIKISRGSHREVPPSIVSLMARQIGVTTPQFVGIVDCTMTAEQFYRHLAAVGPIMIP